MGISSILGSLISLLPFKRGGTLFKSENGVYKVQVLAHKRRLPSKLKTVRGPDTYNTLKQKLKALGIPNTFKKPKM